MRVAPLPYWPDSAALFERLRTEPWPVFLDSGWPHARQGRWDILSANPWARVVLHADGGEQTVFGHTERVRSADPWALLRDLLPRRAFDAGHLPFVGGLIGYLGYDLARPAFGLPARSGAQPQIPELAIGVYDWAVLVDHARGEAWLVGAGFDADTKRHWEDRRRRLSAPTPVRVEAMFRVTGPTRANFSPQAYAQAFARAQEYIRAGDCYQVNLAQRFSTPCAGEAWAAYRTLRRINPAPFSAYLAIAGVEVLSSSPERFLRFDGETLLTQPIKGTRRRALDPEADAAQMRVLAASEKDRAENLMIVDLLRNDLGKVCMVGSVEVERLFEVQSFANVHHLVSSIRGRLRPGRDAFDVLAAAFPGGSITGAPKKRAMEIIDELEPHPRGVYCGSLVYVGYDGRMDSNIAIRTLVRAGEVIHHWAGGGLVADSDPETEYQECLDKAAPLTGLLEGLRAAEEGKENLRP